MVTVTSDLGNKEKEITDFVRQNKISDFAIIDAMKLAIFPKNFVKCNSMEELKQEGIKEQVIGSLLGKNSLIRK